jgi:hypothetical protein
LREVLREGVGRSGEVDLHRVVDDQVDGHERLDDLRVLAELGHGRAHGGEVHEERHTGEVLQHDAGDDEGDLLGAGGLGLPGGEIAHGALGDALAVAVAQEGFEDETDGDGEAGNLEAGLLERGQRVEGVLGAVGGELLKGVEGIREAHRGRGKSNGGRI